MPPWAVGKSAQEILGLSKQMADALASPQQRSPAPAPTPQAGLPSADDYTLDPVKAAQQQLEYNFQQRVAPVFQRMEAQLATTSRGLASQQFGDEFRRWGPEIDQLVAGVPSEQRSYDLYAQAVKLVKANHIDEIVAERSQARMAELGVTDRTGSGGSTGIAPVGSGSVDLGKLDAGYKAALDQMGIGPSELHEFLTKTGQTMEQFVESANRKQVITDVVWDRKGRSQVQVGLQQLYGAKVPVKEW